MNKGQFPLAIFAFLLGLIILKMPPDKVGELADKCLSLLASGYLLGYVVALGAILGWFFHTKWQRRLINNEMQRIAGERSRLQEKLTDKRLESSEK